MATVLYKEEFLMLWMYIICSVKGKVLVFIEAL